MAAAAQKRLSKYGNRAKVVCMDAMDFEVPDSGFDYAYTNLALHNLPSENKKQLLTRLRSAGCNVVWGDLIKREFPTIERRLFNGRLLAAARAGAENELVLETWKKEARDYPLTIAETLELCHGIFRCADNMWTYGGFAVFMMK
jgi:hypothetical protein